MWNIFFRLRFSYIYIEKKGICKFSGDKYMYTAVRQIKRVRAVPFGAALLLISSFNIDLSPNWVGRQLRVTYLL